MYTRHYGLKEKPFAIAPDPRYLYMSELHREALAHLLYGINSDGCLILLTGDVGTGKTTVWRCLMEQLPEKTDIAIILNPKLTITELLKTICEELNIPVPEHSNSDKTYIDSLNHYLLEAHAKGRTTGLIIDEAQNLDIEMLEQVRLLTNLETNTHKLLKIILLGQPELRDILSSPQLTQVNQRITSRYHLGPLNPDDVKKYIRHRIKIAGGSSAPLFTPGAIRHTIKISKGVPRIINLLCDRALMGGYAEGRDLVDLKIMKKAVLEVMAGPGQVFFTAKRLTIALLLFLLGICLPAGLYLSSGHTSFPLPLPWLSQTTQTPRKPVIIINPVAYSTSLENDTESVRQPTTSLTEPEAEKTPGTE